MLRAAQISNSGPFLLKREGTWTPNACASDRRGSDRHATTQALMNAIIDCPVDVEPRKGSLIDSMGDSGYHPPGSLVGD